MYNKDLVSAMIRAASTEQGRAISNAVVENLQPHHIELISALRGIPSELMPIYMGLMKGNLEPLFSLTENLPDWFRSGDIILMAGNTNTSEILVKSQRRVYEKTRSSHVAIVKADFICVDAVPKLGVTARLITEVLEDVKEDWRIIRFQGISESDLPKIQQSCTFYLMQPYLIWPNKKPLEKHAYCSELARKIFESSEIKNSGIPKHSIIKPCDFDKIADSNKNWLDVTEQLKPAVELCKKLAPIFRIMHEHYTNGLRLNRERFDDRKKTRNEFRKLQKEGKISNETAHEIISKLHETDRAMKNQFWDVAQKK